MSRHLSVVLDLHVLGFSSSFVHVLLSYCSSVCVCVIQMWPPSSLWWRAAATTWWSEKTIRPTDYRKPSIFSRTFGTTGQKHQLDSVININKWCFICLHVWFIVLSVTSFITFISWDEKENVKRLVQTIKMKAVQKQTSYIHPHQCNLKPEHQHPQLHCVLYPNL